MRIAIASDIHIERNPDRVGWDQELEDCVVIVMAGDVSTGSGTTKEVFRVADLHPTASIVWIAGNHEFYHRNIDEQLKEFREACQDHPRVHFLEDDAVTIGRVRFIGATLWTAFDSVSPYYVHDAMRFAGRCITDFQVIRCGNEDRRFTPNDAAVRFHQSCAFFNQQLREVPTEVKTVIITHFPPCLEVRNYRYKVDDLTNYFQTTAFSRVAPRPDVWIYGHNHYSDDITLEGTRIISNQYGYASESGHIPNFGSKKYVEL